jgi:hypothetical protein
MANRHLRQPSVTFFIFFESKMQLFTGAGVSKK